MTVRIAANSSSVTLPAEDHDPESGSKSLQNPACFAEFARQEAPHFQDLHPALRAYGHA
jgi:hypothetical protein